MPTVLPDRLDKLRGSAVFMAAPHLRRIVGAALEVRSFIPAVHRGIP